MGWWDAKDKYLSVCVFLRKTVVDNVPLELCFTVVSRKESSPLDSNSTVKLMVSSIEFRWFKNGCTDTFGKAVMISSTTLFQNGGGRDK